MKKILTKCRSVESALSLMRHPVCIILDNIRSLHNVGSVFRTADAACVEKLYLCGITGHPPEPEIAKTALGAQAAVPWEYHRDALGPARDLRERGYQVLAVEQTDESVCFWDQMYSEKIALIFGYEIEGISDTVLAECDGAIDIPMFGYKGSLNVSIACGIVLFDILRKRRPGCSRFRS